MHVLMTGWLVEGGNGIKTLLGHQMVMKKRSKSRKKASALKGGCETVGGHGYEGMLPLIMGYHLCSLLPQLGQGPGLAPPVPYSHMGKLLDKGDFQRDLPSEECRPAPARAHQPCGERVRDASPTISSPSAPQANGRTECRQPLASTPSPGPVASTPSPGPVTSPVSVGSHSSLGAALPSEPFIPSECPSPSPQLCAPSPAPQCPPDPMASLPPLPVPSMTPPHCDPMALPLGTIIPDSSSPWPCAPSPPGPCTPDPVACPSPPPVPSTAPSPCGPTSFPLGRVPPECPSLGPHGPPPSPPCPPDPVACSLPPPVPQSDPEALPWGMAPQSLSPHNHHWLTSPVPAVSGLGGSSYPISVLSWWQAAARAWGLSTLSQGKFKQEQHSHHLPEVPLQEDATLRQVGAGGAPLINPDVKTLLEILITKRAQKLWEEKARVGPDCTLDPLGNMLKSQGDRQKNTVTPQLCWETKGNLEQLPTPQQLAYPKVVGTGEELQQKCSQLFWGLPFLHSESLVAAIRASNSPPGFPSVLFNGLSNSFPVLSKQVLSKPTPNHFWPKPTACSVTEPQPSTQTVSWPQPPPLAIAQTQAYLPPSLLRLPGCSPQIRAPGLPRPAPQKEVQFRISAAIQYLGNHLLKKQKEIRMALPSVVRRSQDIFSQLPSNSRACQDCRPNSDHPGVFISPEFLDQLEQHLRQKFTSHHYGLPCETQLTPDLMRPPCKLSGTGQAKGKYGHSWPPMSTGDRGQEIQMVWSGVPGEFQPGENSGRDLECHWEPVLKDPPRGSESSPVKGLGACSEEQSERDLRLPTSEAENISSRSLDKKHRTDFLRVHLSREPAHRDERGLRAGAPPSRLATGYDCAPPANSNTPVEVGIPALSQGEALPPQDLGASWTFQEPPPLDQGMRQVLEECTRFQGTQSRGPALMALQPMNLRLKTTQPLALPHPTFPSLATHGPGANSTAEVASFPREPPGTAPGWTLMTKVDSTLKTTLPAPSSMSKEVQGTLSGTPCRPSEALPTRQEMKKAASILKTPPPPPLPVSKEVQGALSRTPSGPLVAPPMGQGTGQPSQLLIGSLECRAQDGKPVPGTGRGSPEPMVQGGPQQESAQGASSRTMESRGGPCSSTTEEIGKIVEADKGPTPAWGLHTGSQSSQAITGIHMVTSTPTANVTLWGSGSLETRKGSPPSRSLCAQDVAPRGLTEHLSKPLGGSLRTIPQGYPIVCLDEEAVPSESQPLGPVTDSLLPDCVTGTRSRTHISEMLLRTDAAEQPQTFPPSLSSLSTSASSEPCDLLTRPKVSQGQQAPRTPKLQHPQKNQTKMSGPPEKSSGEKDKDGDTREQQTQEEQVPVLPNPVPMRGTEASNEDSKRLP
ncbi:Protein FAM75A3 [Tupaia chinensis]|uniref:Protein FAM75A3 n=1 Tax=Tupaia chinensis TaxID=246437 RepID=L9JD62_TUPCH|nr:Protein FAM75A3 [Tupaia chinensis]